MQGFFPILVRGVTGKRLKFLPVRKGERGGEGERGGTGEEEEEVGERVVGRVP